MTRKAEAELIVCPTCGQEYRYDENRHCWSCDHPACPHCLDGTPQPLCEECRLPIPQHVEPMLATSGSMPASPNQWAFEYKWDGVRALCRWDGTRLSLASRNGNDITARYPELKDLGKALGGPLFLDGEIVALDGKGRPSFPLLQKRMHRQRDVHKAARAVPAYYYVFDVLYTGGRKVMELPYSERRELLEALALEHPHLRVPPSHAGRGDDMLAAAKKVALEGIMAKRLDSLYEPGLRTPHWQKIKLVRAQEFVIGGWTPRKDSNDRVGSLLLGVFKGGRLRYAGSVGTGFSEETHTLLLSQLRPLKSAGNPFDESPGKGEARFVQPKLVAQVEYRRWPKGKQVHQAAFKGLRDDVDPGRVVREDTGG